MHLGKFAFHQHNPLHKNPSNLIMNSPGGKSICIRNLNFIHIKVICTPKGKTKVIRTISQHLVKNYPLGGKSLSIKNLNGGKIRSITNVMEIHLPSGFWVGENHGSLEIWGKAPPIRIFDLLTTRTWIFIRNFMIFPLKIIQTLQIFNKTHGDLSEIHQNLSETKRIL